MEKSLSEVTKKNGNHWFESLLTSSNNELKELKEKMYNLLMEKNQLDTNFHKSQKDLARCRLEYTKMKLLIGRILDNYNIDLEEVKALDIDPEIIENVRREHDQSVLETSIARFEDESLIFVAEQKEDVIALDETVEKDEKKLRTPEKILETAQEAGESIANFSFLFFFPNFL
jgi:hypothetical protein